MVISQHGGRHAGTWVHPQVAVHLAAWISPEFAVAVTSLVTRYTEGEVTTAESSAASVALRSRITVVVDAPPFSLRSVTDVIDMRSPQLYFRVVPGKFTNVHLKGQPDLALSAEELSHVVISKFGCMGQTDRQADHQKTFKGSELLDSCLTVSYAHVELQFKDKLRNRGMLYEGMHENKKGKDTELLVIRSQEQYTELVKMAQTLVINAACLPPTTDTSTAVQLPVEVLLSMEETKRVEATKDQAVAVELTKQMVERTKQMTLEFEMMQFRDAHPITTDNKNAHE